MLPDKALTLEAGTVVDTNALLHGEEIDALGDAGRQSAGERPDPKDDVEWPIATRPDRRRALAPHKTKPADAFVAEIERLKAGVRAKIRHPFRTVRRQTGHVELRYRASMKHTAQPVMPSALSNLWMIRRVLPALDK